MNPNLKAFLILLLPFVLLAVPTMMYLAQSAWYMLGQRRRIGMGVAFIGYSIGNVGFMMDLAGL